MSEYNPPSIDDISSSDLTTSRERSISNEHIKKAMTTHDTLIAHTDGSNEQRDAITADYIQDTKVDNSEASLEGLIVGGLETMANPAPIKTAHALAEKSPEELSGMLHELQEVFGEDAPKVVTGRIDIATHYPDSNIHYKAGQSLSDRPGWEQLHSHADNADLLSMNHEYIDTAAFLDEKLGRHEITDEDGFKRDEYRIGGRNVIFRNRDELPRLGDKMYAVVDKDIVAPTRLTKSGITTSDFEAYAALSSRSPEATILVTNTPEGILKAAIDAGFDNDGSKRVMLDEILQGIYSGESLKLIDSILATTQYDDDGRSERFQFEGFAVVLAALEGDAEAKAIIDTKLALLDATEVEKCQERDRKKEEMRGQHERILDASKLALVHSTQYPIDRNEQGDIILLPSGSQRKDKFPRATVHFTINGQVTSHILGSWENANNLIVANFAKTVEENGTPTALESADTYFSLNPGEGLSLPGAIIVKGAVDQDVLTRVNDKGDIAYLAKDTYNDREQQEIRQLAEEYGVSMDTTNASVLREIALRMAEKRVGAEVFNTIGDWGSQNAEFDQSLRYLGKTIGSDSGAHSMRPEGRVESLVLGSFGEPGGQAREYVTFRDRGLSDYGEHHSLPSEADIRTQRMVVAAGYMPARLSYRGPDNIMPELEMGAF